MSTNLVEDAFWRAHRSLPRDAPGSAETTSLLLRLAGALAERPRIVDIGCGAGAATLNLIAETGGTAIGIDLHEPFLKRLHVRADELGMGDRVGTVRADMRHVPLPDSSADLIWAGASAYLMGFDRALDCWRRLLHHHGCLVLTEAEWTTPDPAEEARAFWAAAYPAMRTTAGNVAAAQHAGWTVAATYLLPESDWAQYYDPLAEAIADLAGEGVDAELLAEVGREITVRKDHGDEFGYTAYVLRPR